MTTLLICHLFLPTKLFSETQASGEPRTVPITIGQSVVALNPWRFHTGDDVRWADPDFEDADWETVDLTPSAGAHDADLGLTGYVPGWAAGKHSGYSGYAWYRMRISVTAPEGAMLALAGPPDVDDAYQIFFNGQLLGGIGDFSGASPIAYATQPRMFPLPKSSEASPGPAVVAFRVWMSPSSLSSAPDVGGIHIAPVLGEASAVEARYRIQWIELIRGYFLEILQALIFAALATMSCSLLFLDPSNRAYVWLGIALLATGAARANLALASWTQWESARTFDVIQNGLLIPGMLGTWTMTWYHWLPLDARWVRKAIILLTASYSVSQIAHALRPTTLPNVSENAVEIAFSCMRLSFLALTTVVVYLGIERKTNIWPALPAIALISIGLFAPELSFLGIPGIWFAFGTGVSRTQFAYAAFDVAMFLLLLRRLRQYAQRCAFGARFKPA
ncbi:MAG TPA: hypothetical protein VF753_15815 [Terriglobales bacterium]